MDTKALPTTATAVQADLKARADFRGIDEAGQVHYLYGMATAMLARVNDENQRLAAALTALVEAGDFAVESTDDVAIMLRLGQATDAAKSALWIREMSR